MIGTRSARNPGMGAEGGVVDCEMRKTKGAGRCTLISGVNSVGGLCGG